MNEIMNKLTGFLGEAGSGALGHALIGLVILIVGLLIVKIITGIIKGILSKVSFLRQSNSDGSVTDLASPIASLFKGLLTIFVLMAVLQHFGLTDVLEPLKDMLKEFMAAIPNVIGAGVIGYAGWIIAKIVSQIVGMALSKVDAQIAEKTGNTDLKVSAFGSAFIFGGILLPITVSALGVLNIPAISEPASAMIQNLMTAVPNVIGAAIIMLVAYFVAKFVIFILSGLLSGMGIDSLPQKMGVKGMFSSSFTPTKLISGTIMDYPIMAASTAAVNVLGIDIISTIFAKVLQFGGGILVGGVILVVGNFLSSIAYQKIKASGNDGLANIARIAIIGLVLAMGLKAMGLADNIVNMAFGFTLGSIAVALALAFGFGGRDAAKTITDHLARKMTNK
jgi:hypothetical protein